MTEFNSDTRITKLLNAFKNNRSATIDAVYKSYRSEFLSFIRFLSTDKDMNIDCYQDAIISLYENLCNDKIDSDTSTVKTYLFAIGKHKTLNAIKKKQNLVSDNNLEKLQLTDNNESNVDDDLKNILQIAIENLGDKCKMILSKFYYENYSIDAIMHDMGYKNENTVKAHKSRCLSQLKLVFKQISKKNGI